MARFGAVKLQAREIMQRYGYDPLETMVLTAQDPSTTKQEKLEIAQVLLPYIYPKLATIAVETEVEIGSSQLAQASLMRRVLEDSELADAAARLSLAAAEASLSADDSVSGLLQ